MPFLANTLGVLVAIDPNANAAYHVAMGKPFAVGQQVWVCGVEFSVTAVVNGQLILTPVTAKI